ncbi:MAG: hypothetical protein WCX32_04590 [Clostridia bacterium]|jgi:hypothetical protein|nr:hypothetical protein [Clostridia bacterium]
MKIAFLKEYSFDEFLSKKSEFNLSTDILVVSYGVLGKVSSVTEVKGETEIIFKLSQLSRELNCVILGGIDFDLYGEMRKSIVVCDSGKLCGISDTIYGKGDFLSSNIINIYETSLGRIGVIVDTDVYHTEIAHALKLYGADFIVCIADSEMNENIYNHIMCAAFDRGLTIVCATNDCGISGKQKCELVYNAKEPFCTQDIVINTEIGIESKSAVYKSIYKKLLE